MDPEHYSPRRVDRQPLDPLRGEASPAGLPRWFPPALLVVMASLAFGAGLTGTFVLDDEQAITRNPVVQGEAPLSDAFPLTFWRKPLSAFPPSFRPLTTLSFALDHRLMGD